MTVSDGAASITARFHTSWAADSSAARNRVPIRTAEAPAASAAARPRPVPMPPAATTGTSTASSTSSSKGHSERSPHMRPPPSVPRTMTRSHPASIAALASSTVSTCHPRQRTALVDARHRLGAGSPVVEVDHADLGRQRLHERLVVERHEHVDADGPSVRAATAATMRSIAGRGTSAVANMPMPPASMTAAARSGDPAAPIGAIWMGAVQPTRSVKAVRSMACFVDPASGGVKAR